MKEILLEYSVKYKGVFSHIELDQKVIDAK